MKHCIIGAGFSGLPVAKKFLDLGEDFDLLDKNRGVGGLWHTGVYRDAHIISSKHTTEFPDFPMPESYPDFPDKAQMQAYFEAYARHFGIDRHIQFNTEVTRVRPSPDYAATRVWEVTLASGEVRRYRTVTIANGHNWSPHRVTHPGHFDGEIVQSNDYWSDAQLAGKRVLVVGYGNTGCDIAVDASRVGKDAQISMRSGAWFFPKMFAGVPLADILYRLPLSYAWLDRILARLIVAVSVGSLSRYGVPTPRFRILDKHPIVNTELVNRIRHGKVKVRPDIARLDGRTVHFVDGSRGDFDTIIYCTGYRVDYPMLRPEDGVLDYEGGLPVMFAQLLAPKYRGLLLTGVGQARTGGGPLYQQNSYTAARIAAFEARDGKGFIQRCFERPLFRLLSHLGVDMRGRLIRPADMQSKGIGEVRRRYRQFQKLLAACGVADVAPVDDSGMGDHRSPHRSDVMSVGGPCRGD